MGSLGTSGIALILTVLLLGTGSEVHLALEAQAALKADGVAARVVSMPCWEAFEDQDEGCDE